MNKYIITGGDGWLGQNLLDELFNNKDNDYSVNIKDSDSIKCLTFEDSHTNNSLYTDTKIEWITGNLVTGEGFESLFSDAEGATLIHLAGLIHPKIFSSDFNKVNYLGSTKLIDSAIEANISKIVVMSSNSPIGCNPTREHLFTEDSPYSPYMGYGKSKFNLECYLLKLIENKCSVPIVIIRAPWFYGPFQPPRQKLFFHLVEKGKFPILGDGNQMRSMVYTKNLCQGILLAIKKDEANNNIFWIADEKPYSINTIVNTIKDLLNNEFGRNCNKNNLHLPSFVGDIAYCADYCIQSIGLYQQKIHVLSEMNKTIACSIDKSKSILGYSPKFTLLDGMRESIKEVYKY